MKQRYLEVTYRKGKPLAAYLYLPRQPDAKAVTTQDGGSGMRVDYDAADKVIGIEITAPAAISLEQISALLQRLGESPLLADEWAPLEAA